ncbi:MAG: tetratricopeptide repeat protein [Fimbriiglobus sp.]
MKSRSLVLVALFSAGLCSLNLMGQAPTPGAPTLPPSSPGSAIKPPALSPQEEKARELFSQGKLDEAFKQLQEAVKANPKLPPARVQLATYFFLAKQGAAARQNLETAAAEDPKHPDVYLLNASFAFAEGRLTDAILSCQIVLQLAGDPRWDPEQRKRFIREARLGLGSSFEGRRDFNSSKDQFLAILAEEPKNGVVRGRLGAANFMTGKVDEAFGDFKTAIADDPAMELPELQMANLYNGQNDVAKTEEWFKKAVALHGNNGRVHRLYGGWLVDNGKVSEAQLYVDSALRLEPTNKDVIYTKGLFLRAKKDYPGAEAVFESLFRDSPGNTVFALNLAVVLSELTDKTKHAKAIELAENEVRKNSKNPEVLAALSWVYYKTGSLDKADALINEAAKQGGLSKDAGYFAARVLYDRQKFEEAQKVLKEINSGRGSFIYREEANALLTEVDKKVPPPKK